MLLLVAVDQAEHLAHEGGAKVKGEGVQGGEGGEGVGVGGGGGFGVRGHNCGGAGGQDGVGGVGQGASVDVGGAGSGEGDGGLLALRARETRQGDETRLQTCKTHTGINT